MNYCINLKKRKNKPFCKLLNKEISLSECYNCKNAQYKPKKVYKLKQSTYKHKKSDLKRFSIVVDDLSTCCYPGCECNIGISKHEIFYGSYRHTSIKYGLVIPLCEYHHTKGQFAIHYNKEFDLEMKFLAQDIFVKKYSLELFIKEFGMDYIEKYKKKD